MQSITFPTFPRNCETEVARAAQRDLERVVTATGVIKPRVGAEVRVGSRASGVVRLEKYISTDIQRSRCPGSCLCPGRG